MTLIDQIAERLQKIAAMTDRHEIADALDKLAADIHSLAKRAREQRDNPFSSRGGMVDRVQMAVVRNGKVIKTTDTGAGA